MKSAFIISYTHHISIHFIYPYIKHGLLENPPFVMNIFEEATLKWRFFP